MAKIVDTRADSPTQGLLVDDYNAPTKPANVPSVTPQQGMIKGYDTNNNYNPVYVQPGKYYPGISLTPKEEKAITSEQLNQASPIQLPEQTPEDLSVANSLVAGAGQTVEGLMKLLTPAKTEADTKQQSILDQLASLTESQGQRGVEQLKAEQQAGIPDLNKQYADLNAQIQTKLAEYQALSTAQEGRQMSMGSITGRQGQIARAKASEIGLLQAQAQGLQGQLQVAQATVNRAIDLKYQTIDAELKTRQAQLAALEPELNRQEKLQAQAQQLLLDNQTRELEDKKAEEKNIQNVMLEAIQSGIKDQNVLNQISNAKTVQEAITIYGKNVPAEVPSITDQLKAIEAGYTIDSSGNLVSNTAGVVSTATGDAYDIGSYATDPNHEKAVQSILTNMGQMKSIQDMDNYIQNVAPNSPVTGQMIANAATKYGVSWEMMMAIMQQDSSFGTAGKAVRTFNPGNVGNVDSGAEVNYGNWQAGVDAVAKNLAGRKTTIDTGVTPVDETSRSILAQTGLSMPAFSYLTQGTGALTRMNADQRLQYMNEAENWANKQGIDISTFQSQYSALNKTVQANLLRNNQATVAEAEIDATLANVLEASDESSFGKIRLANVAKLFAGQEYNDPNLAKYAFHLNQLREEFALYNAALSGQIDANGNVRDITEGDLQRAEEIIKDGMSQGSLEGFKNALLASKSKMETVLQSSIDAQNKQVWDLFGVGENYQSKSPVTLETVEKLPKVEQGFWSKVGNWLWGE